MKKTRKFLSLTLAVIMCLVLKENYVFADNGESIAVSGLEGKTGINVSVCGDDLEKNMVDEAPLVTSFTFAGNAVNVCGCVDLNDKNTEFSLSGTAYRTYDNNIVVDAADTNNKYDVVFLCLEKKQEYNDYILHRDDLRSISDQMGEYGLKIYLMEKGTRNISIMEDLDVEIPNIYSILSVLDETGYSKLNWFENCFAPITDSEDNIEPYAVTHGEYTYWGDAYFIGSGVRIQMGIKVKGTNDAPAFTNKTSITSKMEIEYLIKASDPAYNNPARAEDEYQITNIKIKSSIGQGYYLQRVMWNGSGIGSISVGSSLSLSVGISKGAFGADISFSPNLRDFKKENWVNLVNSECDGNLKMPRVAETKYDNITLRHLDHYLDFCADVVNNTNISEKFKAYSVCWTFDVQQKGLWGYSSVEKSKEMICVNWL